MIYFTTVTESQGSLKLTVLVGVAAVIWLGAPATAVRFIEVGSSWGFLARNTYGSAFKNTYILESTGNGAVIFDFDGDGRNDVLITNGVTLEKKAGEGPGLFLYRNEGAGQFREVGAGAGLKASGWAQGACAADFDNDGDTDLAISYYGHNRLFRSSGRGFEDWTQSAGLPVSGTRWGSGCAWVDYDRDGFVDLFFANYIDFEMPGALKPGESSDCIWKGMPVVCGPVGLPKAKNALYRNRGDGTFEDVSAKAGILKPGGRFGLGVAAADFNNDGWPDIYVACDQTPSELYENTGKGTFIERGVEAGVAYNVDGRLQSGMGVAVTDFNGDGLLDIAKTNFSGDLPSLYVNEDGRFFRDTAREAGLGVNQLLGWGIAFLDIDEDGLPDLLMANGHVYPEVDRSKLGESYRQLTLLYRNAGDGKFRDVTSAAGAAFAGPRPARGLAIGDLDGDGRPEVVLVNMNEPPTVLKNETPRGNWLRVALEGTTSNRSAIGARVTVEAGGRKQVAEVSSGGSYYSQNDLALYFGLGGAKSADVTIRWPRGAVQKLTAANVNQTLKIKELSSR